jgi:two-component system sensor histidine kinase DesK
MPESSERTEPARRRPFALVGLFFAAIWLVFLFSTLQEAWTLRGTSGGVVALVALIGFAAVYLWLFAHIRTVRRDSGRTPVQGWVLLGLLALLAGVVVAALGQDGSTTLVFLVVSAMQVLSARLGLAVLVVMAIGNELAGRLLPGWQEDTSLTLAIMTAGLAMWGVMQLITRNRELMQAREENARLAVAEERNRFARDLHDILGHSLTVITMKSELAGRLVDTDPARARAELDEIQSLSRDALADVRRAVTDYRAPTLSGELARARQALAAAGIAADLPGSTDGVPSRLRELFAWTIREGVTNVVRHSGAAHCRVRLSSDQVEVRDDGRGPGDAAPGNGLTGLRERAATAGATLVTETLEQGFVLRTVAHG